MTADGAVPDAAVPGGAVPRTAGRLLIVDADGRVLLIEERTDYPRPATQWHTPGGGVESGESPAEAAVREAVEETGISVSLPPDAEPITIARRQWRFRDTTFDQTDHLFLAIVPSGLKARARHLTEVEQHTRVGMTWWTTLEVGNSDAEFVPPNLPAVVADLVRRGAIPASGPLRHA